LGRERGSSRPAMKGKSLLPPGTNFFHPNTKTQQTTSDVSRNASILV
jgi:hypothetical protein